jgi:hypothetical protein
MKWGRNTISTTSRMASHGMNAAIMAGMLRRSSSPASTANPKPTIQFCTSVAASRVVAWASLGSARYGTCLVPPVGGGG